MMDWNSINPETAAEAVKNVARHVGEQPGEEVAAAMRDIARAITEHAEATRRIARALETIEERGLRPP